MVEPAEVAAAVGVDADAGQPALPGVLDRVERMTATGSPEHSGDTAQLETARIWLVKAQSASTSAMARELGISRKSAEQLMLRLQAEGLVSSPGLLRNKRRVVSR